MAAILSCLCWDSQAMEIPEKVMDVIWHFTGGNSPWHLEGDSCTAALLTGGKSSCRGEQVLSWAVACLIGKILVWNSSGHWLLIWIGLLEGLVNSEVLLPETWHCNYWLVKRTKRIKPAFICVACKDSLDASLVLVGNFFFLETKFCIYDRALSWCRECAPVRCCPKQSLPVRCPEADFAPIL